MTAGRLSPSIFAGLQRWADRDNAGPKSAVSPAVLETADFVRRKAPVTQRDVAMRFGLTMAGANKRLRAAQRAKLIRETGEGWVAA